MELTTARLRLDALLPGDARALFAYRADPAAARFQGWHPADVAAARAFIDAQAAATLDQPGSWYQRAIRLCDSGALVGDLGLHFVADAEATVELGISIAPSHQGVGLAGEALRAALGYIFETLHKHRVFGSVDPRNHACVKLLEAVGLRQEAHFRESLRFGDGWADDVIFAMLERGWLARHSSECHRG